MSKKTSPMVVYGQPGFQFAGATQADAFIDSAIGAKLVIDWEVFKPAIEHLCGKGRLKLSHFVGRVNSTLRFRQPAQARQLDCLECPNKAACPLQGKQVSCPIPFAMQLTALPMAIAPLPPICVSCKVDGCPSRNQTDVACVLPALKTSFDVLLAQLAPMTASRRIQAGEDARERRDRQMAQKMDNQLNGVRKSEHGMLAVHQVSLPNGVCVPVDIHQTIVWYDHNTGERKELKPEDANKPCNKPRASALSRAVAIKLGDDKSPQRRTAYKWAAGCELSPLGSFLTPTNRDISEVIAWVQAMPSKIVRQAFSW